MLSTRRRAPLGLCVVAGLSVGVLLTAGATQGSANGSMVAWGCAGVLDFGQCTVPAAAASDVTAIAAGPFHNLALKQDGSVIAWGCGDPDLNWGQCTVPAGAGSGVTAIAAAYAHSLALKQDGSVIAWGCGGGQDHGQCSVPAAAGSGVTAIAAGEFHSLALKQDGSVIAWGCAGGLAFGQCTVPAAAGSGVTAVAAGGGHSLALKQDGSVIAWGCGGGQDYGQCSVPAAAGSGVTAIAAASGTTSIASSSLALKEDGSVVAWGCDGGMDAGQCTVSAAAASGVTVIAAGTWHSLALKTDGNVVAWGCGFVSRISFSTEWGQCTVPAATASGVRALAAGQSHSLALLKANQTITFGALTNRTFGDPDFAVSASASSGLPVSFAASGNCTVSLAIVRITGAGSCSVTASQPGDANYSPAPDVSRSFAIAKAGQSIAFGQLGHRTYGDPDFAVSATASSGLAVSFAASGNCALSGATVHLTGAGSCALTALQAGDSNYNPAPDVSQSFAIAKAGQSITFGPLANKRYGAPDFRVSATASSGLVVSFAARGKCTLSGATVHLTGAGSCTVTASQPGDANYNAAPDVSRTFSIAPAPCRVPKVVGRRVASAKRTLAKRHCRTGKVGYAYSRTRKQGIVISQSRRPGRVLPARSKINLIVSRGRRRS
jgi:alpha-tubulin suppressor-like RCC1 family protein